MFGLDLVFISFFWRKSPILAAFNAAAVSEGVASFVSPFRVSYLLSAENF